MRNQSLFYCVRWRSGQRVSFEDLPSGDIKTSSSVTNTRGSKRKADSGESSGGTAGLAGDVDVASGRGLAVMMYPSHPLLAPVHGFPITRPFNCSYTALFNIMELPVTQVPLGKPAHVLLYCAYRGRANLNVAVSHDYRSEAAGRPVVNLTPFTNRCTGCRTSRHGPSDGGGRFAVGKAVWRLETACICLSGSVSVGMKDLVCACT